MRADIRGVVTETCDGLAAEAERKRQHLDCHLDQRLPKVTGDKHRLIQVLANLVGNALKFSGEEGHVMVTATTEDGKARVKVIAGEALPVHHMAVLQPWSTVRIEARSRVVMVLLGGSKLDGERLIWWNFVASSKELIASAGARWRERKFAPVPDETEFIPLPEMPSAEGTLL